MADSTSSKTLTGLVNQLLGKNLVGGAVSGAAGQTSSYAPQQYAVGYNPNYVTPEGNIVGQEVSTGSKWGGALSAIFQPLTSRSMLPGSVQQAGFPIWGAVAIAAGALVLVMVLKKKG